MQQGLPRDSNSFLSLLGAPARRALENNGIFTLQKLSTFTEAEILKLHGLGPSSIPLLRTALKKEALSFKSSDHMTKEKSAVVYKNVDHYISLQEAWAKPVLEKIRQTIRKAVPAAEEVISYQVPAFRLYGMMMFFAAFKKHYSVFTLPRYLKAFTNELASYKTTKSAINIPVEKPVPVQLITKIAKYAAAQNSEAAKLKLKKKK